MDDNDIGHPKKRWNAVKALLITGLIGALSIVVCTGLVNSRPQSPPQEIGFESVFHDDVPVVFSKEMLRDPDFYNQLFLLTSISDVQHLSRNYSPRSNDAIIETLSQVDYSQYGVLVAYMGASVNTGSAITIEKVIRIGNTVEVRTIQNQPESGDKAIVNYFHAIVVKRSELPDPNKIIVSLWINENWNAVKGSGNIPH